MNEPLARFTTARSRSHRIERELGQGGMATGLVTEVTARLVSLKRPSPSVTPAKAGVQFACIPAFAGMTIMSWTGIGNV